MINFGFWKKLPKPFFALAPMADVTDCAFRRVIAKYGRPNVMWTEFVSADGLIRATEEGKKKLLKDLEYTEAERPIVAQLFGSHPEYMKKASALCAELGFDGIDINMGCPDKGIEKQGAGAAMIKTPALAREIIRAAKAGAPNLPISVKTRVGFNKLEIETWIPEILKEGVAALTIHARTRKEMSKVPANWDYVKRVCEIRNEISPETLVIGNGDVKNMEEGRKRVEETGCDGVMIGRGIFGTPWLFSKEESPDIKGRLLILLEHTKLFDELLGTTKNFAIMKKHFKAYVKDFDHAVEPARLAPKLQAGKLREKLMVCENALEVERVIKVFLKSSVDNSF